MRRVDLALTPVAAAIGCVFMIGGALTVLGDDDLFGPTLTPAATAVPPTVKVTTGVALQSPIVGPIRAVLERPGAIALRHLEPRQLAPAQLPPQRAGSSLHRDSLGVRWPQSGHPSHLMRLQHRHWPGPSSLAPTVPV